MVWMTNLSGKQRKWILATVILSLTTLASGMMLQQSPKKVDTSRLTVSMTIKEIAPLLGVTGKSLARDLNLPLSVNKNTPLSELNVQQETLTETLEHILSHTPSTMKYYLIAVLVLWGLVFLIRLGRPDGSTIGERKSWYPRWVHVLAMLIALGICGFLLGKSPNPMEGVIKVFKSIVGLYPDPLYKVLAFAFFIGLSVIGSKLLCGWACPFGALQELVYSVPFFSKLQRWRLPRWLTISARGGVFLLMLLILFGVFTETKGSVIYHYVNPFNLFNFDFDNISIIVAIIASLLLGLVFYRPFCQLLCPFGFVSWLLERLSIFQVKINHNKCISCGSCAKVCPTTAVENKVNKDILQADCFSCGRCLNTCPVDALEYGCTWFTKKQDLPQDKTHNI